MYRAQQQYAVQMYTGSRPKNTLPSQSTATSGSFHARTASSGSGTSQTNLLLTRRIDTGVADPKNALRTIDAAREEINRSHLRNLAVIDKLAVPFKKYVEQEDLVAQLAKSCERC